MMTNDEILQVVQAHKDGKALQYWPRYKTIPEGWIDMVGEPFWNFRDELYRVKPEPRKPREWFVGETINGGITSVTDANRLFLVREVIDGRRES